MRLNGFAVSPHFVLYEFESRDTREVKLAPRLVEVLERLRELVGKPVVVLSGYRTAALNAQVGGVAASEHRGGRAADVTWAGFEPGSAVTLAEEAGADGIGIYRAKGFVHVDVRGYLARWSD